MRTTIIKLTAVANEPGRFLMSKTEIWNESATTNFELLESENAALIRIGELLLSPDGRTCVTGKEGRVG